MSASTQPTTDRDRIIEFLVAHPDWVDAYRLTCGDRYTALAWNRTRNTPTVNHLTDTESSSTQDYIFALPPEGEWRPKPEPEVFELKVGRWQGRAIGSIGVSGDRRMIHADPRFAGHTVRVTVEAIDEAEQ